MKREDILTLCNLDEKRFQELKELQEDREKSPFDNSAFDLSGGNYDDAMSLGRQLGWFDVAEELLRYYKV